MTLNPITNQPFTTEDADRLLGLADQFLSDMAEAAVRDGNPDTGYEQINAEWEAIRPLFEQAPAMIRVLAIAYHRGYFDSLPFDSEIERQEKSVARELLFAMYWNHPTREQRLASTLQSCVEQMEQCRKLVDDPEFAAALDEAQAVLAGTG